MVICRSADNKFHCITKRHHDIVPVWNILWADGGIDGWRPCSLQNKCVTNVDTKGTISDDCLYLSTQGKMFCLCLETIWSASNRSVSATTELSAMTNLKDWAVFPVPKSLIVGSTQWCNAETPKTAHQLLRGQAKKGETDQRGEKEEGERTGEAQRAWLLPII